MKFNKILESIAPHRHAVEKFDDFLRMAVCAFSMGKMEPEYEEVAKKYSKEEIKSFGDALGQLFLDYDEKSQDGAWKDILGNYFEETGNSNARMGQFFTPDSLCNMMAQITATDITRENTTINDPTCGSGRNLIAHCRLAPDNRSKCFYTGSDLDYRCVLMTVINFVMYGMRGVVIHMDALSMKVFKGYRIWMPETGLFVQPLTTEECNKYLFEERQNVFDKTQPEIIETISEQKQAQLTLW